jgi:50S ribosomal subunit-associated GTPase HflX
VSISAITGEGLDDLRAALIAKAASRLTPVTVRVSAGDGALQAFLRRRSQVVEERYEDEDAILTLAADPRLMDELRSHPGISILAT